MGGCRKQDPLSADTSRPLINAIQQAVDTAGMVRREEHVAQNAAPAFKEGQA